VTTALNIGVILICAFMAFHIVCMIVSKGKKP